ncbi:hypothetical protein TUM20985_30100 [Mycobacterium antarcticum]|nr:hypothetical protein TUM20985_30100 [Mycolicibacterium sp. TUM20985]
MEVPTGLTAVSKITDSPATTPIAMIAPSGAPTWRTFRGNADGCDTRAAYRLAAFSPRDPGLSSVYPVE